MLYSILRYKLDEYYRYKFKSEKVVVKTNYGPVMGIKMESAEHGYEYMSFQGIPYAKPPVGPLRFRASISIYNHLFFFFCEFDYMG